MVAIPNISFRGTKRGRRSPGVWLVAASVMLGVTAGASLAEVTGGSDPSLPATAAPVAVPAEPAAVQPATVEDAGPRLGAEEQRRIFMLLLLNSAGPLRPYSGLSPLRNP